MKVDYNDFKKLDFDWGNEKTIAEQTNSICTMKFFLYAFSANKYKKIKDISLSDVREEIMQKSRAEWHNYKLRAKTKKFYGNKLGRLRKSACADLRNVSKEKINVAQIEYSIAEWLDNLHNGYETFCDYLPGVMQEITGQRWGARELVIKEGDKQTAFEVVVREDAIQHDFFNVPLDYEQIVASKDGFASLNNYLAKLISNGSLVIVGEKGLMRDYDRNSIKLHPSYFKSLPAMSLPIKKGDVLTLMELASFSKEAQNEIDRLTYFNKDKDGNFYFDKYEGLINMLRGAVEQSQIERKVSVQDVMGRDVFQEIYDAHNGEFDKLNQDFDDLERQELSAEQLKQAQQSR